MLGNGLVFPDWNSVESVRNVHSVLEAGALLFFAALVVLDLVAHIYEQSRKETARRFERIGLCCFAVAVLAEILAYPYSRRNDFLSEQQNVAQKGEIATLERESADAKAEQQRVEFDLSQQREKTARAESALLEVKHQVQQRALSSEQRLILMNALTRIPKVPIAVSCVLGDHEGCSFAEQFRQIFVSAGWKVMGDGVTQTLYPSDLVGFFLHIRPAGSIPTLSDIPASAAAVQQAFLSVGLRMPASFSVSVPGATLEILIAGKALVAK
jgi:hypothetical protein